MEKIFASGGLIAIMTCSLIYSFFGYRFFKILLGLSGALIVGTLTWMGFNHFAPELQIPAMIVTLIMAAIGAWLFHKAFKVAAFLYGSAAGVSLSPAILVYLDTQENWIHWTVPIACGIIGGLLLLISRRIIIIIMTAITGSIYFTMSLFLLLVQIDIIEKTAIDSPNSFHTNMWLLSFALCFICGLLCQLQDKASKK